MRVRVPVAALHHLKPRLKTHPSLDDPQQVDLLIVSVRIARNKRLRVSARVLDAHGIIHNDIIVISVGTAVESGHEFRRCFLFI